MWQYGPGAPPGHCLNYYGLFIRWAAPAAWVGPLIFRCHCFNRVGGRGGGKLRQSPIQPLIWPSFFFRLSLPSPPFIWKHLFFIIALRTDVCYNIFSATILGRRLVLLTEDCDLWSHRNLFAEILWKEDCVHVDNGTIYIHYQLMYYLFCSWVYHWFSEQ